MDCPFCGTAIKPGVWTCASCHANAQPAGWVIALDMCLPILLTILGLVGAVRAYLTFGTSLGTLAIIGGVGALVYLNHLLSAVTKPYRRARWVRYH